MDTAGCQSRTIAISIRLLQPRDEEGVHDMIWRLILRPVVSGVLRDNILSVPLLMLAGVCALAVLALTGSRITAIATAPAILWAAWLFGRYIICPWLLYKPEMRVGVFSYWGRNDLGRRFWVAESSGRIIGACAVDRMSQTTAEVHRVCVAPEARGLGVAKQLMGVLFADCRAGGIGHVVLHTSYVQVAAAKLYQGLGFKVVDSGFIGIMPLKFKIFQFSKNLDTQSHEPTD